MIYASKLVLQKSYPISRDFTPRDIAHMLAEENVKIYGLPLRIVYDKVKPGRFSRGAAQVCVVLMHPHHLANYSRYIIALNTPDTGNTVLRCFYQRFFKWRPDGSGGVHMPFGSRLSAGRSTVIRKVLDYYSDLDSLCDGVFRRLAQHVPEGQR